MEHPQQHVVQVGRPPSRGSSSDDAACLVGMCPALYRAANRGRTEEVMALLLQQHAAGAAAKDRQDTGIIQHGQCDILEVSAEGNTVIHVAAEQGHHELIQELYVRFNNIKGLLSHQNSALDTPLHCAARAGHVRTVAILIQLAQDYCGESILGCKNEAGDSALHMAARHGHGAATEVLVSVAPELAAELNNAGVSPLYLAVMSGSVQALRAIIACKDASAVGPSLQKQNALHAAVFKSSVMVDLLLEWRPALAEQVDGSGSSPLHIASSDGDSDVVRAILRAAPPRTVYKKDSGGLSALFVAARMGHHRVVNEILEWCPDAAELRDDNGGTFVHAAAKEKSDSFAKEKHRHSVVSLAIENPMLRGLLDVQDKDGNTPLHLAVAAGAPRVVDELLRKGKVRADILNNDGRTALDLAAGSTSFFTTVKLVVMLVGFGAQLRPQRQDHLKLWSGHDSIAKDIERTSDSLAVVAVLIATAALAAGFNVPGGYGEKTGEANLEDRLVFKGFLVLDISAVAASVVAVILLVYGKASRSAGSWKSFAAALQCMWASLICLMLAFYAVLDAVTTTKAVYRYGFPVIFACIVVLSIFIMSRIEPVRTSLTVWRFMCHRAKSSRQTGWRFMCQQRCHLKGWHAVQRQFPLAGAYVLNLCLFTATYVLIGIVGFVGISWLEQLQRMF
ncbi:hypothetical protein SEVIR_8G188000v4 [Setaria viridis]|uniref:PGG domain-containing protein n=1 Tax=Setaria viridis TaxID=4556 RepID=A0A4U6TGS3_SETVI|nr:ankyrin repeat-containing protein ITN1-like isoform X2 [Setaria viridis]TKW01541.1 hypothetical protein SEVIR_8G188000v2 [Setaria viridis]